MIRILMKAVTRYLVVNMSSCGGRRNKQGALVKGLDLHTRYQASLFSYHLSDNSMVYLSIDMVIKH